MDKLQEFSDSFPLRNSSEQENVIFTQYRAPLGSEAPPGDLGSLGDIFLDTNGPMLYGKTAERKWTKWEGQKKDVPHPVYSDRLLGVRDRVNWIKKKVLEKTRTTLLPSKILKNFLEKEEKERKEKVKEEGKKRKLSTASMEPSPVPTKKQKLSESASLLSRNPPSSTKSAAADSASSSVKLRSLTLRASSNTPSSKAPPQTQIAEAKSSALMKPSSAPPSTSSSIKSYPVAASGHLSSPSGRPSSNRPNASATPKKPIVAATCEVPHIDFRKLNSPSTSIMLTSSEGSSRVTPRPLPTKKGRGPVAVREEESQKNRTVAGKPSTSSSALKDTSLSQSSSSQNVPSSSRCEALREAHRPLAQSSSAEPPDSDANEDDERPSSSPCSRLMSKRRQLASDPESVQSSTLRSKRKKLIEHHNSSARGSRTPSPSTESEEPESPCSTPIVLRKVLQASGRVLCSPSSSIETEELDSPRSTPPLLKALQASGGVPHSPSFPHLPGESASEVEPSRLEAASKRQSGGSPTQTRSGQSLSTILPSSGPGAPSTLLKGRDDASPKRKNDSKRNEELSARSSKKYRQRRLCISSDDDETGSYSEAQKTAADKGCDARTTSEDHSKPQSLAPFRATSSSFAPDATSTPRKDAVQEQDVFVLAKDATAHEKSLRGNISSILAETIASARAENAHHPASLRDCINAILTHTVSASEAKLRKENEFLKAWIREKGFEVPEFVEEEIEPDIVAASDIVAAVQDIRESNLKPGTVVSTSYEPDEDHVVIEPTVLGRHSSAGSTDVGPSTRAEPPSVHPESPFAHAVTGKPPLPDIARIWKDGVPVEPARPVDASDPGPSVPLPAEVRPLQCSLEGGGELTFGPAKRLSRRSVPPARASQRSFGFLLDSDSDSESEEELTLRPANRLSRRPRLTRFKSSPLQQRPRREDSPSQPYSSLESESHDNLREDNNLFNSPLQPSPLVLAANKPAQGDEKQETAAAGQNIARTSAPTESPVPPTEEIQKSLLAGERDVSASEEGAQEEEQQDTLMAERSRKDRDAPTHAESSVTIGKVSGAGHKSTPQSSPSRGNSSIPSAAPVQVKSEPQQTIVIPMSDEPEVIDLTEDSDDEKPEPLVWTSVDTMIRSEYTAPLENNISREAGDVHLSSSLSVTGQLIKIEPQEDDLPHETYFDLAQEDIKLQIAYNHLNKLKVICQLCLMKDKEKRTIFSTQSSVEELFDHFIEVHHTIWKKLALQNELELKATQEKLRAWVKNNSNVKR